MRFVTRTSKGIDLDLPDTLRLVHREAPAPWEAMFDLRAERPGVTPVLASETEWLSYRTSQVHSWKTEPTARLIFLAMRRSSYVPADVAEEWGKRHEHADDVKWYRRRRTNLGTITTMTDWQLEDAFEALLREALEREGDRLGKEPDKREREFNLLVGGRPLSTFTEADLDHLWVAIDWHRAGRLD